MEKRMEKIWQWIADEPAERGAPQNSIDVAMESALSWILRNVGPVLMVALVIDLTILFTVPVEATMSRWFWLKSPLSIAMAYFICKSFMSICRHPA